MTAQRCSATADECICDLDAAHDDAHECSCGGMWTNENGIFTVVKLPGEAGVRYGGDTVGALLGLFGFEDEDDA